MGKKGFFCEMSFSSITRVFSNVEDFMEKPE